MALFRAKKRVRDAGPSGADADLFQRVFRSCPTELPDRPGRPSPVAYSEALIQAHDAVLAEFPDVDGDRLLEIELHTLTALDRSIQVPQPDAKFSQMVLMSGWTIAWERARSAMRSAIARDAPDAPAASQAGWEVLFATEMAVSSYPLLTHPAYAELESYLFRSSTGPTLQHYGVEHEEAMAATPRSPSGGLMHIESPDAAQQLSVWRRNSR